MSAVLPYHAPPTDRGEVVGRAWIELMAPAVELAKAVAGTDFVPKALRNNAAAIAAAILYGDEVGLGPMQALAKIAVIDGRPALAAEAQRALILAAGHELWLEEYTISAVTIAGRRAGGEVANRVTWTLDDARRANLAGKPNWRAYPRQMLLARASAELARATFADVIGGLAALEELEADDSPPGDASGLDTAAGTSTTRKRQRRLPAAQRPVVPVTSTPAEVADALPPLPGEEGTAAMSDAQRRKLMALYRDLGLGGNTHRAERLRHAGEIVGRPIGSANDLNADDAAKVLAALELEAAHPPAGGGSTTGDDGGPESGAVPAADHPAAAPTGADAGEASPPSPAVPAGDLEQPQLPDA